MDKLPPQRQQDYDDACKAIKQTTLALSASGVDNMTIFAAMMAIMYENQTACYGEADAQKHVKTMLKAFGFDIC